jgi:hypothetical protein
VKSLAGARTAPKPSRLALGLLVVPAILGTAPRPAGAARSISLDISGGRRVRVLVPRVFAPLLPGSVYPNRREPVEPRALAFALVESDGGLERVAGPALLARGLLVVEIESPTERTIAAVLEALAARPEADASRGALVVREKLPLLPAGRFRAAAVFDPADASPGPPASPPDIPVLAFLRTPAREPSAPLSRALRARLGAQAIEKWYRSENGFPGEAFRDLAEWISEMTSAPAPRRDANAAAVR